MLPHPTPTPPYPHPHTHTVQVGDPATDHNQYWGRPEQQPQGGAQGSVGWRPAYVISSASPGADIVSEVTRRQCATECNSMQQYATVCSSYAVAMQQHAVPVQQYATVCSSYGLCDPFLSFFLEVLQ